MNDLSPYVTIISALGRGDDGEGFFEVLYVVEMRYSGGTGARFFHDRPCGLSYPWSTIS